MTDRETVLAEKPREESPDQKGEDVFSETNNSYLMGWRLYLTTIG